MPRTPSSESKKKKVTADHAARSNMLELAQKYLEAYRILSNPDLHNEHAAARHRITSIQRIWSRSPDYFKWPKIRRFDGGMGIPTEDWMETGILKFLGYEVGAKGELVIVRRMILDDIYLKPLPKINSSDYMSYWGEPETPKRLKKLANSLNQFAELQVKNPTKRKAVRDWLSDLDYLHHRFYVQMISRLKLSRPGLIWYWPK